MEVPVTGGHVESPLAITLGKLGRFFVGNEHKTRSEQTKWHLNGNDIFLVFSVTGHFFCKRIVVTVRR